MFNEFEVIVAVSVTLSAVALFLSVMSYFPLRSISEHVTNPFSIFALILIVVSLYLLHDLISTSFSTTQSAAVASMVEERYSLDNDTVSAVGQAEQQPPINMEVTRISHTPSTTEVPQLLKTIQARPKIGNPDADYTVAIFTDIECDFCQQHHAETIRSVELLGDRVNFTYLNLPNQQMHGDIAIQKAVLAECVNNAVGGNAYFSFITDMFFAKGEERGIQATSIDAEQYLNGTVKNCGSNENLDVIQQHVGLASKFNVRATPTAVLLNNKTGQYTFEKGLMSTEELKSKLGI